jgi:hypothetical protein
MSKALLAEPVRKDKAVCEADGKIPDGKKPRSATPVAMIDDFRAKHVGILLSHLVFLRRSIDLRGGTIERLDLRKWMKLLIEMRKHLVMRLLTDPPGREVQQQHGCHFVLSVLRRKLDSSRRIRLIP